MSLRPMTPLWGLLSARRQLTTIGAFVLVLLCGGVASAQPKKGDKPAPEAKPLKADKTESGAPAPKAAETKKNGKEQNFNFNDLNLNGRSRSPQLLYFLERANEELERASLEKRSFIPHMVRTVEEEAL